MARLAALLFLPLLHPAVHAQAGFINVKSAPFNAAGDGKRNDRPALQAALDSASRNGGTVFLPPGVYKVDAVEEKGRRLYCLLIASKVKLLGSGRDASTILLADNQPNETRILTNRHHSASTGDSNITFEDFSIDGNAGRQKSASCSFGIRMVYTQKVIHNRILVKNVKGTPAAEGTAFESYSSSHNSYVDCEATQTIPGDSLTGSGFSVAFATGIEYRGCRASRSTSWMGFTAFHSRLITYTGCHGYSNLQRGFNCERSSEVQYVNCIAGGRAASHEEGYPRKPDQSLGNGDGFYVWNSENVLISNCIAMANHRGINNFQTKNLSVVGGIFSRNNYGICVEKKGFAPLTRITGAPVVRENRMKAMSIEGMEVDSLTGPLTPPAMAASDSDFVNPFPFAVTIRVEGGTVRGAAVQGRNLEGFSGGSVRLPAGGVLKLRYAKPPAWSWEPD